MSDNVIGKKITEYRKQNKMTQQEFADKLFVTNKTVSRWETGYTLPNGEQLVRIAEVLGITLDELMGNEARADGKDGKAPAAEIVRVEVPVEVPAEVKRKIPWGKIVAIILACVVFVSACFVTGFWISKKIKEDELLKTELAKWQATDKFEAEWAHISAVAASLDTNGNVENTEYGSNGQCIAQFGVKGNTLTFNIVSSKSTTAQMYIAVVSHLEQDTPFYYITTEFDDVWNLYVNPTEDQIEKEEFIQTKQTYTSTDASKTWYDFVEVCVEVELREGENVIKFVVPRTGNGEYGLNMDYIRFETDAELKWKPYKENKVRPPDPPGVV